MASKNCVSDVGQEDRPVVRGLDQLRRRGRRQTDIDNHWAQPAQAMDRLNVVDVHMEVKEKEPIKQNYPAWITDWGIPRLDHRTRIQVQLEHHNVQATTQDWQ